MRVASRVVVLVRDASGYGAALADALLPPPGLTRDSSPLELPLDKYGLKGEKASGELVSFSDSNCSPQVSFFVLPDYKPPVAACAMNEILALISSEASPVQPVIIVPFITRSSSSYGMVRTTKTGQLSTLYGSEIGATNEFTHMLVDGTTKPPPSLQIRSEPILCLLEMVCVLKIPIVLLVASGGQHQGKSSSDTDLEVLQCLGDHLGRHINLEFSKQAVLERGVEKLPTVEEPWRELYR